MDIALDVLKWVVVILIAGIIGQFGKSLSLHIIDYFKKKKENGGNPLVPKETEERAAPLPQTESFSAAQERDSKTTKKALKAEQKARKKMEKARKKE